MYGILWYPCKPAIVTHLCPKCAPIACRTGWKMRFELKSLRWTKKWQSCKDSNLNKVNQNHLCYRYTTGLHICKYFLI